MVGTDQLDVTGDPARDALVDALGVSMPGDLIELALVHRSYAYENGLTRTNERLEFLGDAVLGFVVTDALFRANPGDAEGQLSRMRIAVVSRPALAQIGRALGIGDAVRLGRGEETQGGRDRDSILADTTEAVIGAVYLAHGIDVAHEVVLRISGPLIAAARQAAIDNDQKTTLQELAAQQGRPPPRYEVVSEAGPTHNRLFTAAVRIADATLGLGTGATRKAAEQAAAALAVIELTRTAPGDQPDA